MQKQRTKKLINKKSNGTSVGSFGSLNEGFSPTDEQSKEIIDKFKSIIYTRLDKLYDTKGADGELYAYGIAVNQVKKKAEQPEEAPAAEETPAEEAPTEEPMDKETKLKEMIQAALSKPLSEKKAKPDFLDLDRDRDKEESMKKAAQDKKKMQMEDLDLGHQDDEPHMIKAELARIGKYAMELYKMVDQFEGPQEVDFPAWWQAKITTANNMISSAKHYLEFELEEPKIDAIVDVASQEGVIDERDLPAGEEKIVKGIKKSGDFKKNDPALYAIARSIYNKKKVKNKIKEAILTQLKDKK